MFKGLFDTMRFGADVQSVVTRRMLMLASGAPESADETRRMMAEKMSAAVESQIAFMTEMTLGHGYERAAKKAFAPYRKRVHANLRRLG